jgi:hypothetical protein
LIEQEEASHNKEAAAKKDNLECHAQKTAKRTAYKSTKTEKINHTQRHNATVCSVSKRPSNTNEQAKARQNAFANKSTRSQS